MPACQYLMENEEEILRLEMKTEGAVVERQARWAGIQPGMRVADIGCGSGKTSFYLHQLVGPEGKVVGLDGSEARIGYAREKYRKSGLTFECGDFFEDLSRLGTFDFIWVRFVLEYFRENSFQLVERLAKMLRPGGIMCLIDLDFNCMAHFGLSARLERNIIGMIKELELKSNFDPYVGRKLYSYMYDLGLKQISVSMEPHHLIFGDVVEKDLYNWKKKLEIAGKNSGWQFKDYAGGFDEFYSEFEKFFSDPRRFTYTPSILCRGVKA